VAFIAGFLFKISKLVHQLARTKKNRRVDRRFLEFRCVFVAYAKVSLPPGALEIQK